ncbi:MAG TPA: ATP synthase F1 subunit delta [Isosphaeraceae bacterium]|jgi:F-type H+-transporting ATPase subunit delta|nr:ATP synthase F1 subunit delta [Isosphaeraceae bacterium]
MSQGAESQGQARRIRHRTVLDESAVELSRPYAEAFVNVVDRDGQADAALEELDAIVADIVEAYPDFAEVLTSPSLQAPEKDRILVATLDGHANPIVLRFLRVLNQHGRLELLPAVARQARALLDRRRNRRSVTVKSAIPLDDDQRAALRDRLARLAAAEPVVSYEVDPGLIGGLVVQVGDDVYDASARARLDKLRRQIVAARTRDLQSRRALFEA